MTKAYNNPYYPLPIKWTRVKEPIIYNNGEGIAMMPVFEWVESIPYGPVEVWYPEKISVFKPYKEVLAEQEYYAKLEEEFWKEETRKCIEDPKYYFAKYTKFINLWNKLTQ